MAADLTEEKIQLSPKEFKGTFPMSASDTIIHSLPRRVNIEPINDASFPFSSVIFKVWVGGMSAEPTREQG